ncbi:hypothetical protein ACIU1J_31155 [Azospirillum doebereinerae]|uniref:hypothetical protein n=1 Tax=Azospirillum doebereinerae TaxID=92933 RepID=UPI001EE4FB57|nr:hypothetical protein [Azospirillum doebereinerae]MCG5239472.1 hypothetical protein [Azospirillum doebereinerae]
MARSNPLMMFAKQVAAEMASGGPGQGVAMAMAALDRIPDAAEQLLGLIVAESGVMNPDGELIEALALLLGQALESLRFATESGHGEAATRLDGLRAALVALVGRNAIDVDSLMLVVRQFTVAGVDPGNELRSAMVERMGALADSDDLAGDPLEPLALLATEVEDEFTLFALIREMTGALPDEHRTMLAAAAFAPGAAPLPGLDRLREAALGLLFDSAEPVRRESAALLGAAAERGELSGITLRRMIALRNWVPAGERAALDDAIRKARLKGVAIAPLPSADVREVFATGWDGAGAQSLFFVVKEGRRFALAALLLKQGFGVRDAWVQHGGTKRDADGLLGEVEEQVGLVRTTMEYAAEAAAFALGINAASGVLPPFGLIDAAETAGLANLQPETVAVEALVETLCADLPSGPEAESLAFAASATWRQRHPFTQSWFESGDEVGELLGRKRLAKGKAADLILDQCLEGRRRLWAERIAWTAAALRQPQQAGRKTKAGLPGAADWADFALVARALLAGTPLRALPVMVAVARASVEHFA